MTLSFFKSVKSAAVLMGIAGILLFAGGAWADDPAFTASVASGEQAPSFATPGKLKVTLSWPAGAVTVAGNATVTIGGTNKGDADVKNGWVAGTSAAANTGTTLLVATVALTTAAGSVDFYIWSQENTAAGNGSITAAVASATGASTEFASGATLTTTVTGVTVKKAKPTIVWPVLKSQPYAFDKTLEDYSTFSSTYATTVPTAKIGASQVDVKGDFLWVNEDEEFKVDEASKMKHQMVFVPKEGDAANFLVVFTSDTANTATRGTQSVYNNTNGALKNLTLTNRFNVDWTRESSNKDVSLTVTKLNPSKDNFAWSTATATNNGTKVYDGKNFGYKSDGSLTGFDDDFGWKADQGQSNSNTVTIKYQPEEGGSWVTTVKNAGRYVVGLQVTGAGNFNGTTGTNYVTDNTWKIEITKKPIVISNATHTKVYDGTKDIANPASGAGKVTAGFTTGSTRADDYKTVTGDNVSVTVDVAEYSTADALETDIEISGATLGTTTPSSNYKLVAVTGSAAPGAIAAFDKIKTGGISSGDTKTVITMVAANASSTVGITQKSIKIDVSGHVLPDKIFNGDSLANLTTADGVPTTLAFSGLEGDDEGLEFDVDYNQDSKTFTPGKDYAIIKAVFASSSVGDDKVISSGRVTLNPAGTKAKNYKFSAGTDSALANKNVTGNIIPRAFGGDDGQVAVTLSGLAASGGAGIPYTGSEITLTTSGTTAQLKVTEITTVNGKTNVNILKATDYDISYEDNIDVSEAAKVIITPTDGGNYAGGDPITAEFKIIKRTIKIATTGHTVDPKYYDGTQSAPVAKIAFTGLVAGDDLKISTEDEEGDYTVSDAVYANATASANPKAVTGTVTLNETSDLGKNYTFKNADGTLSSAASIVSGSNVKGVIDKMPLVIIDVTTDGGRVYNGSDSVGVTAVSFATVVDPETPIDINRSNTAGYKVVGAKYDNANAETGKQIAYGTVQLTGSAYTTNYDIPEPSLAGYGNDNIDQRDLAIDATKTKVYKAYDGNASVAPTEVIVAFVASSSGAGLLAADAAKEGYIVDGAAFEDEVIGKNKFLTSGTVTLTGFLDQNYKLSDGSLTSVKGEIGKGKIPIRGVVHTKVYDNTKTAKDVAYSFDAGDYPLWDGDITEQLNAINFEYTSVNAGTTTIKPAGIPTFKSSAPAALKNFYEISTDVIDMGDGTGITKKDLAFTTVNHTKQYDGTTTAGITSITWATGATTANALVSGDAASTVLVDTVDAEYTSAVPGTKDIKFSRITLKGTKGANYNVLIPDTAVTVAGGITQATLTVAGVTISKTYDGTNEVTGDVKVTFNGLAPVDTPFVDYEVANVKLADKNAGTKSITGGTVSIFGAAVDNYNFPTTAGNLAGRGFTTVVEKAKLKILAAEHTKKYDGNTTARNVKITAVDEGGLVGLDTAWAVDSVNANYTGAIFGTKTLRINRVYFKGGNYTSDTTLITLAEGGITGVAIDSIKVTAANGVDSIVGRRTLQLTAQVFPDSASIKAVKWTVSDTSLASVGVNGLLTSKKNGTVVVTASAQDSTGKKGTFSLRIVGITVSVAEVEREIPTQIVISEAAVAPVKAAVAKFTAGPSPAKVGSSIKFFSGSAVKSGSLYIFDASGNAVAKVSAKAGTGEIGSWDLKAKNGATVSEGTYIVKGGLIGKDGTREKVSFVFSVVK